MKILIISQYFWPENFRVNEIVEYLSKKGHEVTILTGPPNYPDGQMFTEFKNNKKKFYKYFDSEVIRIPIYLRRNSSKFNLFINYISFIASAFTFGVFFLRKKNFDVIFSFGTSPITSALPGILFGKLKNAKSILWVLDLWPNILRELRIVNNKIFYKLISLISEFIYKKTDFLLAQSKSYETFLKKLNSNTSLFYSWPETSSLNLMKNQEQLNDLEDIKKYSKNDLFKIVFTGNIGEAQNFDKILEAAKILKNENVQWIIVGSGRFLPTLKETILREKINNFIFLGAKSFSLMKYYHQLADVLLISLKSGTALSGTIPGKLQTYLASGKFILGMIDGEAKAIIDRTNTGICVDPNKPEDLARLVLYLKNNRSKLINKDKTLVNNFLLENFNKLKLLSNFEKILFKINNSYEKIKLISDPNRIPFKENFTISGLNLAFLGYLSSGQVRLAKSLFHWPDGIFKSKFFDKNIPKISGKNFLINLNIPNFIERIYIIGVLSFNSLEFLKKKFNKEIIHIKVPYSSVDIIAKSFDIKFNEKDLLFITLPTPKQEQLADFIINKNLYYKIICFGGAIAIASGDEKPVPRYLDRLGLEFLWRLKTDTKRRVLRLAKTSYYYFLGEVFFKYKKIKTLLVS